MLADDRARSSVTDCTPAAQKTNPAHERVSRTATEIRPLVRINFAQGRAGPGSRDSLRGPAYRPSPLFRGRYLADDDQIPSKPAHRCVRAAASGPGSTGCVRSCVARVSCGFGLGEATSPLAARLAAVACILEHFEALNARPRGVFGLVHPRTSITSAVSRWRLGASSRVQRPGKGPAALGQTGEI